MRTRVFKINGQDHDATLIAGITGLVKVYHVTGHTRPFLKIGRRLVESPEAMNDIVMRFVRLRYMNRSEHERIIEDFKELCEAIG